MEYIDIQVITTWKSVNYKYIIAQLLKNIVSLPQSLKCDKWVVKILKKRLENFEDTKGKG
jgi:hypothetical protein